jgi:hypothetical protein
MLHVIVSSVVALFLLINQVLLLKKRVRKSLTQNGFEINQGNDSICENSGNQIINKIGKEGRLLLTGCNLETSEMDAIQTHALHKEHNISAVCSLKLLLIDIVFSYYNQGLSIKLTVS